MKSREWTYIDAGGSVLRFGVVRVAFDGPDEFTYGELYRLLAAAIDAVEDERGMETVRNTRLIEEV